MAFLNYRQSYSTITQAQKQKIDVVHGRPLTMFEVDSNFTSINKQLISYRNVYGLGSSSTDSDIQTIQNTYGSDNINLINKTSFFSTTQQTQNVPLSTGKLIGLHIQNTNLAGNNDASGFQLIVNNENVFYRIKTGKNTWKSWQNIVDQNRLSVAYTQLSNRIDQCVKNSGGTITGALQLDNVLTTSNNINVRTIGQLRGNLPIASISGGINLYDKSGQINGQSRLGFIGLQQKNQNGENKIALIANNPVETTSQIQTSLQVGWKTNNQGNYIPFTYAPFPVQDENYPNLIATTGWVTTKIEKMIDQSNSFSGNGGVIHGQVQIQGQLKVDQTVYGSDIDMESNIIARRSFCAPIQYEKPLVPPESLGSVGNGFWITDAEALSIEQVSIGRVYGQVTSDGTTKIDLTAYNWADESQQLTKGSISITVDKNNNIITEAPTPPQSDNSNQIATTEWSNKQIDTKIATAITEYQQEHPWDLGVL